jgi:hypothetical protein
LRFGAIQFFVRSGAGHRQTACPGLDSDNGPQEIARRASGALAIFDFVVGRDLHSIPRFKALLPVLPDKSQLATASAWRAAGSAAGTISDRKLSAIREAPVTSDQFACSLGFHTALRA